MIRAVTALHYIAERKIEEAIARGELDNLPGAGRPLDLDDVDPLLPAEMRMAWRILKNSELSAAQIAQQERSERTRALRRLGEIRPAVRHAC
jgi:hypothetical protein